MTTPLVPAPAATALPSPHGLTRPRRLVPGDRVAVVAPSGPIDAARLAAGCAILRSWGLEPVVAPHVLDVHPRLDYFAGTDEDRAADFQQAWLDPTIAAVICARGGYGAQRVCDLLDWNALRAAPPKLLVGFSDVTALHEELAVRLGLASLYGPMGAAGSFVEDPATSEHLRRTLFDPAGVTTLTGPQAGPLVPGRAHGITAGGACPSWPPNAARRVPAPPTPARSCCSRTSTSSRTGSTASSRSCCAPAPWTA